MAVSAKIRLGFLVLFALSCPSHGISLRGQQHDSRRRGPSEINYESSFQSWTQSDLDERLTLITERGASGGLHGSGIGQQLKSGRYCRQPPCEDNQLEEVVAKSFILPDNEDFVSEYSQQQRSWVITPENLKVEKEIFARQQLMRNLNSSNTQNLAETVEIVEIQKSSYVTEPIPASLQFGFTLVDEASGRVKVEDGDWKIFDLFTRNADNFEVVGVASGSSWAFLKVGADDVYERLSGSPLSGKVDDKWVLMGSEDQEEFDFAQVKAIKFGRREQYTYGKDGQPVTALSEEHAFAFRNKIGSGSRVAEFQVVPVDGEDSRTSFPVGVGENEKKVDAAFAAAHQKLNELGGPEKAALVLKIERLYKDVVILTKKYDKDLDDAISGNQTMNLTEDWNAMLEFFSKMIRPLSVLHGKMGMVHRDIKSSNYFVQVGSNSTIEPFLGDFGITRKQVSPVNKPYYESGAGQGTAHYLAPELQENGYKSVQYSPQSDLYALGVTFLQVLDQRPQSALADGDDAQANLPAMQQKVEGLILSEGYSNSDTNALQEPSDEARRQFLDLVQSLTARNPNDRPKNAMEVEKRLETIRQA